MTAEAGIMGGVGDNVRAVLHEVVSLLRTLLEEDEAGSIDLGRLPLSEEDYDRLRKTLGEGEVSAVVEALGPTRIRETGIPGVWWVTHLGAEDEVIAEFLEIAYCPEILISPVEEVSDGLQALQARLFASQYLG